jgi:creatinine amidohydrolase
VTRYFADLRAPEVATHLSSSSIILQPVGAIEQHGPHLPLSVDLVIAEACAQAVVAARGEELNVWLLPPLAITKSNEHTGFPGSLSLKATTMLSVLDDIAAGIAATPARKLVFLNGHGGNSALLNVACREIRVDHGLETFLMHPFVPPDQGGSSPESELGMGIHAGHEETSVMLHLAGDLVDMSVATRNVPERLAQNQHVRFGGTTSFGWLASDFGADGHIGDPTGANPEEGKRLFELSVDVVGRQLEEVSRFSFG